MELRLWNYSDWKRISSRGKKKKMVLRNKRRGFEGKHFLKCRLERQRRKGLIKGAAKETKENSSFEGGW